MPTQDDLDNLFFTPAELGKIYVDYARYIQSTPGVKFHVKSLDDYVIPPRAGQLVVAVARPGQGKTSFAIAYAKKTVADIMSRSAQDKECVLYITYDQPTEEIYSMFVAEADYPLEDYAWGRIPADRLVKLVTRKVVEPFWVIGRSVMRTERQADMTFENLFNSVHRMKGKWGVSPSLIVIDYIQNIAIPRKEKRSDSVGEASIQAKELGKSLACPILVLAQAGRQVDNSETKIPGLADCQHSSQLEQDATKVFGLMRPAVAMPNQTSLDITVDGAKRKLEITPNLMLLQVAKQRMTKAGKTFALYLNPSTLALEDLYTDGTNKH